MKNWKFCDFATDQGDEIESKPIRSDEDLRKQLHVLRQRTPGFVDLISPGGSCLSIGVGGPVACVMFMNASKQPPYLWALAKSSEKKVSVEFDREGTPTPVPARRCIPFEEAEKIAVYFLNNERLPDWVKWDED